jgi:hypothetical protein
MTLINYLLKNYLIFQKVSQILIKFIKEEVLSMDAIDEKLKKKIIVQKSKNDI